MPLDVMVVLDGGTTTVDGVKEEDRPPLVVEDEEELEDIVLSSWLSGVEAGDDDDTWGEGVCSSLLEGDA